MKKKIVISSAIGNALEWYDYAVFGQLSPILAELFFPSDDKYISLIKTFAVFAMGFVMRPIGGILFGLIGDKFGRKISLLISVLLMAIPTAMIGLLPTYEQIGITSSVLMIIIRLLQGLSMGGEFSGSTVFTIEHFPKNKQVLAGSVSIVSLAMGVLLGAIVAKLTTTFLDTPSLMSWGWRVPFLISILFGLSAWHIRKYIEESPQYIENKKSKHLPKKPIKTLLSQHLGRTLLIIGIRIGITVPFYNLSVFLATYLMQTTKCNANKPFTMNIITSLVLIIVSPISAHIADTKGRAVVLFTGLIGMILFTFPSFLMLETGDIFYQIIGIAIISTFLGIYFATAQVHSAVCFPSTIRYTGMSVAHNFSVAIFGGTTPIIQTWLIHKTGNYHAAPFYMTSILFLALLCLSLYYKYYNLENTNTPTTPPTNKTTNATTAHNHTTSPNISQAI